MLKWFVELGGTAKSGNNSLWVYQYKRLLPTNIHVIHCEYRIMDYSRFNNISDINVRLLHK